LLFLSKFALRVAIHISSIASQREHEQQFSIQARRGHLAFAESLNS